MRTTIAVRILTAVTAAGLLAMPALTAAPVSAKKAVPPQKRAVIAPNITWPVGGPGGKDLKPKGTRGTEIKAKCGRVVRAIHSGVATVSSSPTSGPHRVRIATQAGGLVSWYGYMSTAEVTSGQLIQAGQPIGRVGKLGKAKRCSLYVSITSGGKQRKTSNWLNRKVGKPGPPRLFGSTGFVVASFNTLGASHTKNSKKMPDYQWRTPRQANLLAKYDVDVVGLQEFQKKQRDVFLAKTGSTYGIFPFDRKEDTENSIIWRNSTMQFVSGETIMVPYLGRARPMPVVLLRHRSTGKEAYFINVHNPASGVGWGNQTKNRKAAIAIERAKVVELRATGRAVFLTGDLNDKAPAFCGLTAGKLMISPDSIPSMACAMPKNAHIDWVLAAGPARFTRYARDWKPKNKKLTDHPIVWARVHLADYQ